MIVDAGCSMFFCRESSATERMRLLELQALTAERPTLLRWRNEVCSPKLTRKNCNVFELFVWANPCGS